MNIEKIYAKRIFYSRLNRWNKITDNIYTWCNKRGIDPYIFLAVYYIEEYFRPKWFQVIESLLLKTGIRKNPSIGPFQVRYKHLTENYASLLEESMKHVHKIVKDSNLIHISEEKYFIRFGSLYNLDGMYGKVMYQLYLLLKKEGWKYKIQTI